MKIDSVLFVGLGSIGQRHLRNLRQILGADVRVSAFRVRGEQTVLNDVLQVESTSGLDARFSVHSYKDLGQALKERPRAVFVTNPSQKHLEPARAAVDAGCALFVEKPLAADWDGVAALVDAAERKKTVAMVGYQMRFHPMTAAVAAWLKADVLGRIVAARFQVGEYLPNFHRYEDYRRTYAARADLGGGSILTQIHETDLIHAFFGLPERAFCVGGHLSDLEIDVEDAASTIFECRRADGSVFPVHLHQDYLQRPVERGFQIIGDRGKIEWNHVKGLLVHYDHNGTPVESLDWSSLPRNQMFMDEMKHFLSCVESGRPTLVGLRDGAASLAMALAAKRSMNSRQPESVEAPVAALS